MDSSILSKKGQVGFTLTELMIGLALTLVATVIVFQVFARSEANKRSTTGASDAQQIATVNLYQVGRYLRSAGNGFLQSPEALGCAIKSSYDGSARWPGHTLPTPFSGYNSAGSELRLAPVIIIDGGTGSDVVFAMGGDSAGANIGQSVRGGSGTTLLVNSIGFKPNDVLLVSGSTRGGACYIHQIDSSFAESGSATEITIASAAPSKLRASYTAPDGAVVVNSLGNSPLFYGFGILDDRLVKTSFA
jgi:type IV pilus assembly protein PilW